MTGKRQIDVYEHVVWSESGPTPAPGNKTTAHAARAVLWVIARRADFNTLDNSYSDLEYIVGTSGAKKSAVYNALSWLEDEGWLYKHNNHACKYACLVPQSAKKIAQSIMQRWECELQLRDKSFYKPETSPIVGNDDPELSDNRKNSPINGKCDSNNRNELSNNRNPSPLIGSDFQSSEQTSVSSSVLSTDLTKEEEEVVQGSIDDASDIDGENPPPPDLILEHQGTPLAAREGILPAEKETPTVKDSEPEDPDVRWKKPWKENLEPRADRMRTIYSSAELRKIWELGMDVYPTLWGYKVGDDELVAKWLVYKVGDLVSRKVKTGSWYKSLVDIEECSAWCAKNSNAAPSFVPTSGSHTPTAEELEERKRSRHAAIMADWNEKKAREAASEGGES